MKKTLLAILIILTGIATATAKPDVTVIKGSLVELKKSNAKMFVRWDYTNSTIEGKEVNAYLKERGDDWVRDYDAEITRAESNFRERLDEETKDVQTTTDESSAEYTIIMKVKDFNYGITGLAVAVGFGAGDSHLYGTIAECQTLAMPNYVHSIPNNNDNQDIVSMGTNTALICKHVVENCFQVMAIQ